MISRIACGTHPVITSVKKKEKNAENAFFP
jgi:hypothetical protein